RHRQAHPLAADPHRRPDRSVTPGRAGVSPATFLSLLANVALTEREMAGETPALPGSEQFELRRSLGSLDPEQLQLGRRSARCREAAELAVGGEHAVAGYHDGEGV